MRVVDYTADDVKGFNAVVKRIGSAAHPQTIQAPIISKQIIQPIAYEAIAPMAPINSNVYSYSSNLLGLEGLGGGWGLQNSWGLNSWDLGGHGYGGLKY